MQRFRPASLIVALFVLVAASRPVVAAADWIYLDLGEVVVTGNPTNGYTFVPGALEALAAMRADGKKIALLSNIPESWGPTCAQKFAALQTFLGSRLNEPMPMDWTLFDAVVLPPFDRYRKPQPLVFVSALHNACDGRAMFIGENDQEIAAASQLGFATFSKATVDQALPVGAELEALLAEGFTFEHPADCDFAAAFTQALLPQDAGTDIRACIVTPN